MSEHTPGPWRVSDGLNNDGSRPVSNEGGRIAFVHVRDENAPSKNLYLFDDVERDANARLIAACPTMFAALQHVEAVMTIVQPRSDTPEYLETLSEIRAAIALASPSVGEKK